MQRFVKVLQRGGVFHIGGVYGCASLPEEHTQCIRVTVVIGGLFVRFVPVVGPDEALFKCQLLGRGKDDGGFGHYNGVFRLRRFRFRRGQRQVGSIQAVVDAQ